LKINSKKIYIGIVIIVFILMSIFVSNMRHDDLQPTEKDNSQAIPLSVREDMIGKSPITLKSGNFIVGVDIPAGRYSATTVEYDFGSVTVYELGTKVPEVSEILGFIAETAYVESIALTLIESQEIKIERLGHVVFTPLHTELKTELTTGIWEVGHDIKPGTYTASSKDGLSGSIALLSDEDIVAILKLGNGESDKKSEIVTLKNGQVIRISRIPTVIFEEVEKKK